LYTHADPVNGIDPSGLAVYFMVRPIDMGTGDWVMALEYATGVSVHGYLYVTDIGGIPNNNATFSWHPYRWMEPNELLFSADMQLPGRIWKNDARDNPLQPGRFKWIPITNDPTKQAGLLEHLYAWQSHKNVGWEEGNYGDRVKDYLLWKGRGTTHVAPTPGAEYYCFLSHNCFWWAKTMLIDSKAMSQGDFDKSGITWYNLGAGTTNIPYVGIYQAFRPPFLRDMSALSFLTTFDNICTIVENTAINVRNSTAAFFGNIFARIQAMFDPASYIPEDEYNKYYWDGIMHFPDQQ
jgi:hypothetical protein